MNFRVRMLVKTAVIIFTIKFRNRKRDNIYIPETSALQILTIIVITIIIIIIIIIITSDTSKSKL